MEGVCHQFQGLTLKWITMSPKKHRFAGVAYQESKDLQRLPTDMDSEKERHENYAMLAQASSPSKPYFQIYSAKQLLREMVAPLDCLMMLGVESLVRNNVHSHFTNLTTRSLSSSKSHLMPRVPVGGGPTRCNISPLFPGIQYTEYPTRC